MKRDREMKKWKAIFQKIKIIERSCEASMEKYVERIIE